MAQTTLMGDPTELTGKMPAIGSRAPDFTLVRSDLTDCPLSDFSGQLIVLNIFPSLDTPVCAFSVRRFNLEVGRLENTVVLCVSGDLPFAHQRFCESEGLDRVIPLSVFRSPGFGRDYGLLISSGPLRGLLARGVVIIDQAGQVVYTELVPEIAQEPDYEAALAQLEKS